MKKKLRNRSVPTRRAHIFFSGRVQGVGFRYTAEKIALEIGLVGWVKNLPANQVEVLCEGSKESIDLFIERLKACSLGPCIKKVVCDWEKPTGEFKDFCIEYYY